MRYYTIRELQKKYGATLQTLSVKMGCCISMLSKISNNRERITKDMQNKCYNAFKCYLKNDILLYDKAYNELLIKYNELLYNYDNLNRENKSLLTKLKKIGALLNE